MSNMTLLTLVPGSGVTLPADEAPRAEVRVLKGAPTERLWRAKGYVTPEELKTKPKTAPKPTEAAKPEPKIEKPVDKRDKRSGGARLDFE